MDRLIALKIIWWVSLAGLIFSGYLSYVEIFHGMCALGTCKVTVFSIPPCIYGFLMYFGLLVISCMGIKNGDKNAKSKN